MTNKRKLQRAKRAQNDTILRNKRVKYLDMQIASDRKKEALMYDPITGLFYRNDWDRIRKLSDSLASLGWIYDVFDTQSILDILSNYKL